MSENEERFDQEELFESPELGGDELGEFNEIFGEAPTVDDVAAEAGLEEAQALESPEVEPPSPRVEERQVEMEAEVEPPVESRQETAEPDVVVGLREQVSALARLAQEQSAQLEELQASKQAAAIEPESLEFIPDDDRYQEALLSREAMNGLLADVYRKMVAKAREVTLADAGRAASTIARNTVQQARMVSGFYEANPDLLPYRDYVTFELRNMSASNPSLTAEDALRQLAPLVRQKVGLGAMPTPTAPAKKPAVKPAFPGRAPSRPPSRQQLSALEQEFNEVVFGGET